MYALQDSVTSNVSFIVLSRKPVSLQQIYVYSDKRGGYDPSKVMKRKEVNCSLNCSECCTLNDIKVNDLNIRIRNKTFTKESMCLFFKIDELTYRRNKLLVGVFTELQYIKNIL
jgi:hypothetical protein